MTLDTIRPRTSVTRNGVPLTGRMQALLYQQALLVNVEVILYDQAGNPRDLTGFNVEADDSSEPLYLCTVTFYEASTRSRESAALDAIVSDADNGVVTFQLNHDFLPGIYLADIRLANLDEEIVLEHTLWVYVAPTRRGDTPSKTPGPEEIRTMLYDAMPDENFYADELEFDLTAMCQAASQCVEYWNETPPPLGRYTTTNFPHRRQWCEGITGLMFRHVAEFYRKNDIRTRVGGVEVADMAKWQRYMQEGEMRWKTYRDFVDLTKVATNLQQCWGVIS